mmetsp:Transcript_44407/g.105194  ORF Transcript_44407/g.105194 Transcript_44407/m.105194 type:complete len:436 (+) Transcript_44407:46-1353(+)
MATATFIAPATAPLQHSAGVHKHESLTPSFSAPVRAARTQLKNCSPSSSPGVGFAAVAVAAATISARQVRKRRQRQVRGGCPSPSATACRVAAVADAAVDVEAEVEKDNAGRLRLKYQEKGWKVWNWTDGPAKRFGSIECHYIVDGPEDGPPVVLVHGFGANAYHWRYQVPELAAKGYRVYALDLLGYGWGPRMVLKYTGEVWAAQISSFLREVVGGPACLVGNSVGAFVSLLTSALAPDQVTGLVMLNAAGRWEENQQSGTQRQQLNNVVAEAADKSEPGPILWILEQIQRAIATWSFYTTKAQIGPILESVYENDDMVDEFLIDSIRTPADHPDALDAFGELIQAGRRTEMSVFQALDALPQSMPILLLWGQNDPWMRPARADAIRAECADRGLTCKYVPLVAGHCPHDDVPEEVNRELVEWLGERSAQAPSS